MGNKLRSARKAAGLSQSELAEKCGVPQSNISRYELGKTPFVDDALKIAVSLGVTVETLWGTAETLCVAGPANDGPVLVRGDFDQTGTG